MLGFLFHKKRDEVKRILHGRMNRAYLRTIAGNEIRGARRGTFTEVVWAIPYGALAADADYTSVFPAMTKDLSAQGISILHREPLTEPRMIIGLKDETEPRFLLCRVEHSTALGHGFYQTGLFSEETFRVEPCDIDTMREALEKYDNAPEQSAVAGV
jgi:hypothetical protein